MWIKIPFNKQVEYIHGKFFGDTNMYIKNYTDTNELVITIYYLIITITYLVSEDYFQVSLQKEGESKVAKSELDFRKFKDDNISIYANECLELSIIIHNQDMEFKVVINKELKEFEIYN